MNCSNIFMPRSDASTRGRDTRERHVLERGQHGHDVEAYGEGKETQEARLRDWRGGGDGFSPMAPMAAAGSGTRQGEKRQGKVRYEVRFRPLASSPGRRSLPCSPDWGGWRMGESGEEGALRSVRRLEEEKK